MPSVQDCELCSPTVGAVLWHDDRCRVILVADPEYAGFCRVIWNSHVREMTDLASVDQQHCMHVVLAVERAVRNVLNPHKINLASFGNMTPHLHWHVIARDRDDAHFPQPVWGEKQRTARRDIDVENVSRLREALASELSDLL